MVVDYAYYAEEYGGGLAEAAFTAALPMAEAHVKWLCAVRGFDAESDACLRAVCAACDAFAEFGSGEVGGYTIGRFSVKNYENRGTTGEEIATMAALKELVGTAYPFCGVC